MDKANAFKLRVDLIRALDSKQWDVLSRVSGSVTLAGESVPFFEDLLNSGQAEWLGPGASPVSGQTGTIRLCIQNGQHTGVDYGYAVEKLGHLLAFEGAKNQVLEPVYVAEYDWASGEPNEPQAFQQYRLAIELMEWLRGRADHHDSARIVFLLSEKLEINPAFEVTDLDAASFDGLATLKELLASDLHKDQRRAVAVKALIDMLSPLPIKERFSFLLRNLPQYVENVRNGYQLYAAEFSYEKIRDKVEEVRVDIASKINKTISDIQNQILAIPVATILVATQMKYGQENIPSNAALVLASLFFTVLMCLIIQNQKDTLKVLGSEISRQEKSLEKDYDKGAEQFRQTFIELRERQEKQHRRLGLLWKVVLTGLCLSILAALWFSVQPLPVASASNFPTAANLPIPVKSNGNVTSSAIAAPPIKDEAGISPQGAITKSEPRPP